jgi:hypothetical protein
MLVDIFQNCILIEHIISIEALLFTAITHTKNKTNDTGLHFKARLQQNTTLKK